MAGRSVIEFGCGYGFWSWHAAATARHVLATDVSATMVGRARSFLDGVANVDVEVSDIDDTIGVGADRDAVMHVNLVNHLPFAWACDVQERLHGQLGPGASVFVGAEHYYGWRLRMFRKPGHPDDTYATRDDSGSPVDLVDNIFDEDRIRRFIGARATEVEIGDSYGHWWVSYVVA